MFVQKIVNVILAAKENLTGYFASITSDHAYIHDGIAFTSIIDCGSISAVYYIAFKTPTVASGKYIHFRPLGITSSANYVDIKLYEGDTYSGGSAVVPVNRNRLSTNTTDMQAFVKGATVTPTGTILYQSGVGSTGNPSSRSGGGSGADEELVLKQDTVYVYGLTPSGATNTIASVYWYEEGAGLDED